MAPELKAGAAGKPASRLIDQRIRDLAGWRGETLARMRALILDADPDMTEEWKWGVPVWSHHGIVCTGEAYKQAVKLTFAQGARIADPSRLFNSSLEGKTRRAIDIHEGEKVDARAFKALVKAAVAHNGPPKAGAKAKPIAGEAKPTRARTKVVLLSGGNPQIAKARKAVRWNSPFYGIEGRGWFLSFHVLTRYVKVTFFQGLSLRPLPPGGTAKSKDARWIDIHEDDELDEAQMAKWVKQAAALPGWIP